MQLHAPTARASPATDVVADDAKRSLLGAIYLHGSTGTLAMRGRHVQLEYYNIQFSIWSSNKLSNFSDFKPRLYIMLQSAL